MATPEGVEPAPNRESSDQGRVRRKLPEPAWSIKELTKSALHPELVFALVRTLGADWSALHQQLEGDLAACSYDLHQVKLSHHLTKPVQPYGNAAERYEALMDAGDRFRAKHQIAGAVAIAGIEQIKQLRSTYPNTRRAILIDKLVHPDEIELLRAAYGSRLFVIACDAPQSSRIKSVQAKFLESGLSLDEAVQAAVHAINRDSGEAESKDEQARKIDKRYRVAVGDALALADVFVRGDDPEKTRQIITRLVHCIFDHPFHTPTLDELGMALAYQAALTTAALSRRVGAAIMIGQQIVAVGANEVPKAGGGTYHEESQKEGHDAREFQQGRDPSDRIRLDMLADLLNRLTKQGWKPPRATAKFADRDRAIDTANKVKGCKLLDVIEYTRTTHAEMVAITAAARLGIRIEGATLFTTTLPCHECTRNIIAAGIGRVVYLEPYPKSKGAELQSDSIYLAVKGLEECQGKLAFEPFSGFVYWRFDELFSQVPRKLDDARKKQGEPLQFDGESVIWKAHDSKIRASIYNFDFGYVEMLKQRIIEDMLCSEVRVRRSARPRRRNR